jgi:hypothetical protein
MSPGMDWDKAWNHDYIGKRGSERVDAGRGSGLEFIKAKYPGRCYDCKRPFAKGAKIVLRHPSRYCASCAKKRYIEGRLS